MDLQIRLAGNLANVLVLVPILDCPPFINAAFPLVPTDWNAKTHTGMDGMGAILKLMAKGTARASSMEL